MQYEIEVNGRVRRVNVHRVDGRFVVAVDANTWIVDAARINAHTLSLLIAAGSGGAQASTAAGASTDGATRSYEVTVAPAPGSEGLTVQVGETPLAVSVNGRRRWRGKEDVAGAGSGPQRILAPMPGRITKVLVQKGEAVRARQPVIVIEAMKMENELRSAVDGTLAEVHVRDGESVDAGALLAVIHQ